MLKKYGMKNTVDTYSRDVNVVYHCDDLYVDALIVSIYSAVQFNKNLKFHIISSCCYDNIKKLQKLRNKFNIDIKIYCVSYVLFDTYNIPEQYKRLLNPHPIKVLYEILKQQYTDEIPFTAAPLFYFVFHEYIFNFDRYIFLDCDTIVQEDLQQLYMYDLKDKIIAMRRCWSYDLISYKSKHYKAYNGSVYVATKDIFPYMKKMYDHTIENLEWAKLGVQHSMNVVLDNKVTDLDKRWNYSVKKDKDEMSAFIYHYNTLLRHPEIKDSLYKKYEDSCHR